MSASLFWALPSADEAIACATKLRAIGYRSLESYTPYDVPELDPLLEIPRSRVTWVGAIAAIIGTGTAYAIMWFANAFDYPINVGGRPLDSLPADVPIMFETAVLFASLAIFVAVLVRSGLPRLARPIFELEAFRDASVDRFWLGIDPEELDHAALERARAELPGTTHVVGGRP